MQNREHIFCPYKRTSVRKDNAERVPFVWTVMVLFSEGGCGWQIKEELWKAPWPWALIYSKFCLVYKQKIKYIVENVKMHFKFYSFSLPLGCRRLNSWQSRGFSLWIRTSTTPLCPVIVSWYFYILSEVHFETWRNVIWELGFGPFCFHFANAKMWQRNTRWFLFLPLCRHV